jgi:hypothetical protein
MCWRTIGALASEVIEDAMLKAMRTATEGSVVKRALPPPPRDERGVPSRSAVESARSTSKMDRASCGAACAGEEDPLKATRRFETEAGQDAHLDRMHPSRRGYYVIRPGTAGHGHAPTGMWKSIAVNPPPKTPPRPAIDSQMLVVFRSRRTCILTGSSARPQRNGSGEHQRLLMDEPHTAPTTCSRA